MRRARLGVAVLALLTMAMGSAVCGDGVAGPQTVIVDNRLDVPIEVMVRSSRDGFPEQVRTWIEPHRRYLGGPAQCVPDHLSWEVRTRGDAQDRVVLATVEEICPGLWIDVRGFDEVHVGEWDPDGPQPPDPRLDVLDE